MVCSLSCSSKRTIEFSLQMPQLIGLQAKDVFENCIWESQGEEMDVECEKEVDIVCSEWNVPIVHFNVGS